MTGLASDVSLSTVRFSSPAFVLAENLHLEAFGGFLEHALRAFALLQDVLNRGRRADAHADRRVQLDADFVDRLQIARIGHDDHERLPFTAIRHEAVAQHQVGRNAAEQTVVGMEVVQIQEFELIALGQEPRLDLFTGVIRLRAFGLGVNRWTGRRLFSHDYCLRFDRLKSGIYSDSSRNAMTTPITISSTG